MQKPLPERFLHHELPRVQLEHGADHEVVQVHKPVQVGVPADIGHVDADGGPAALARDVPHVGGSHPILAGFLRLRVGNVQGAHAGAELQLLPLADQGLMDSVPLVLFREDVLEPEPLGHRGFDQARGGIGVVLQHFRRTAVAVIDEVEATVNVHVRGHQRLGSELQGLLPDADIAHGPGGQVLRGLQAHDVHVLGRLLEGLHLVLGEFVVGRFVPVFDFPAIGHGGSGKYQALFFDLLLPVRPGRGGQSTHA
ncbi:hypothetical protein D3C73_1104570 [compost metagenome]